MRTINKGLGSNTFRQYGMGKSGRTAREVLESLISEDIPSSIPVTIIENSVTYYRIMFGDSYLDQLISCQPLYGRTI